MQYGIRGISPVVATALLVLIAIATAVLLYLWISGTVQNAPQNDIRFQERIKIDGVDRVNDIVYVRNVGDVQVTISAVYVINQTTGEVVSSNTSVNTPIDPGKIGQIAVTIPDSGTIIVKVVTKNGVEAIAVVPG
ncbi:hypothetical protein Pyrde_0775 [Pyrodictium delaneyi]|uniref:Archaeal Type IV pilin N-terminal domain-containing protein n=1 Tax=Pyrodictium delaneyi TaxID=1273541 RepID=A0A0N7JD02_9CREN|nr:archaellin/type IV pilin N-terminal domain-containing protein [Pyrodictium delaneyi]ALL00825.1 hypothetical protein Pyrde_0775 [Pyrodictium delaneyi]OWJ55544.1 hypothetical protein Pdsh_01775 [Pyrodictium delaneyi]